MLGNGGVQNSDDEIYRRMSLAVPNLIDLTHDEKAATAAEHAMPVTKALKLYRKAIGFSMLISLALVMEGFDTSLMSWFSGLSQFQRKFGKQLADGSYQVIAPW
jgi:SP family general alpha glucoside:H+ symporter-like MFS transporter